MNFTRVGLITLAATGLAAADLVYARMVVERQSHPDSTNFPDLYTLQATNFPAVQMVPAALTTKDSPHHANQPCPPGIYRSETFAMILVVPSGPALGDRMNRTSPEDEADAPAVHNPPPDLPLEPFSGASK